MSDQSLAARAALSQAEEIASQNLSTVEDMIAEEVLLQDKARNNIRAMRDAIANQQEEIRQSKARETKHRQRRRIFYNAAHKLREVDML